MSSSPTAATPCAFPNDYHGKRDKVTCRINGHQFLAYAYTPAQMASMISIGKTLSRLFPNLPQSYPQNGGDPEPMWGTLRDAREYTGYLGHYHVTEQKWDPGPFDFKFFASKIRGRMVFPVAIGADKPDVPDDPDRANDLANSFFDNNETEGEGGYYPVGPYGQTRLWHGGVHLRAEKGTPVFAPFGGKIVAARMTDDGPVGSRNFVLIRSDLPVGSQSVRFWTLLFHLDLETATTGKDAPAWLARASQLADDPIGLSIDVNAGDLVGHVGEAGLPGRSEGQLHVEIMSAEELGEKIDPGFWTTVEGAGMGRFCEAPEIVAKIDKPSAGGKKDGLISRAEMLNFFKGNPQREAFRKLAVHHISEWADNNDWQVALNRTRDFAELPKPQRARLFHDQIEPVLWWTDEVATAAELPSDKLVWNYHPVTLHRLAARQDAWRAVDGEEHRRRGRVRGQGGAVEHQGRRRRDRGIHRRRGRALRRRRQEARPRGPGEGLSRRQGEEVIAAALVLGAAAVIAPLPHTRTGHGPPVVLVHGLGGDRHMWDDVAGKLAATHTVVAVDLPGHGAAPADEHPDADRIARAIAATLQAEKLGPAVIVGHSLGGFIAAHVPVVAPEAARALVIVDIGISGLWTASEVDEMKAALAKDRDGTLRGWFGAISKPAQLERLLAGVKKLSNATLFGYMVAHARSADGGRQADAADAAHGLDADRRGRAAWPRPTSSSSRWCASTGRSTGSCGTSRRSSRRRWRSSWHAWSADARLAHLRHHHDRRGAGGDRPRRRAQASAARSVARASSSSRASGSRTRTCRGSRRPATRGRRRPRARRP